MSEERATQLDEALAALVADRPSAAVLDVGGGSGTRAVPLAARGCRVTVVDLSADALAILHRRALDLGVEDRVSGVQADVQAMGGAVPAGAWDLVICHHVLEAVDEPAAAVAALAAAVRPGGLVSVLVAGKYAAVLAQSLAGRFEEALTLLDDPDGRYGTNDPLARRFDAAGITALLEGAGLTVERVSGVGTVGPVGGWAAGAGHRTGPTVPDQAAAAQLEARLTDHPVLFELGTDLHVLARQAG